MRILYVRYVIIQWYNWNTFKHVLSKREKEKKNTSKPFLCGRFTSLNTQTQSKNINKLKSYDYRRQIESIKNHSSCNSFSMKYCVYNTSFCWTINMIWDTFRLHGCRKKIIAINWLYMWATKLNNFDFQLAFNKWYHKKTS